MRHEDVNLCAVGSLAAHLNHRFHNTRKFHDFTLEDWLDRKVWFNIKLLTDLIGENTAVVNDDLCSDKL